MLRGSLLIIFCVSRAGHVYIYELDSDTLPVSTFAVAGTRLSVSASEPRSVLVSLEAAATADTRPRSLVILTGRRAAAARLERLLQLATAGDQEVCGIVLQKVPSEANPKVRNHGEGPY